MGDGVPPVAGRRPARPAATAARPRGHGRRGGEAHRIACSHYDAYRFFTPDAAPRNTLLPTLDERPANEQPGCLHVGMDVYKWAHKLAPFTPAELVADCFELAREIRLLDLRASPYDLTGFGYLPVAIETADGKAEYLAAQQQFCTAAAPLRQRLLEVCDAVLSGSPVEPVETSSLVEPVGTSSLVEPVETSAP